MKGVAVKFAVEIVGRVGDQEIDGTGGQQGKYPKGVADDRAVDDLAEFRGA